MQKGCKSLIPPQYSFSLDVPKMTNYDYYQNRDKPKHPICAAAIIVWDGKVLMGLREYEKGNPLWTLPGGRCDKGEEPEIGLVREVEEETGINDLKIIHKVEIKEGAYEGENGRDQVHMYHCETRSRMQNLWSQRSLSSGAGLSQTIYRKTLLIQRR